MLNIQQCAFLLQKCEYCRLPGATIGCNTRGCPKNYHFDCARNADCAFQDDKLVYCHKHASTAKTKVRLFFTAFVMIQRWHIRLRMSIRPPCFHRDRIVKPLTQRVVTGY